MLWGNKFVKPVKLVSYCGTCRLPRQTYDFKMQQLRRVKNKATHTSPES